jgi:hypothetical protein
MKILMCQDCAIAVANYDFTGMTEEREHEVTNGIRRQAKDGYRLTVDSDSLTDFATNPCDVCRSRLHGYRYGGHAIAC